MVTDGEMLDMLGAKRSRHCACQTLISRAKLAGAADNITVVLARVETDGGVEEETTVEVPPPKIKASFDD